MIEDIITGIPLGIFLSFLVGPVFFVLLETSAVKGFRAAFVFDLGVVLADILFIAVAYFSSYRLIQSIKNDPAIFIFGGIMMLTYGIISFLKLKKVSKKVDEIAVDELIKKNYLSLFLKGFFLNFINVGVLLFWFMILITIGPKLALEQLRSQMTPTNILKIKKIISILLVIFGLTLMFQGWFPSEQKLVKKALEKIE